MNDESKAESPTSVAWFVMATGIGVFAAALVAVSLNALVPASGYLHPASVPAWHFWIALVLGLAATTGTCLLMVHEGRLGQGSRALVAFLIAMLIWPLAFLVTALGSRSGPAVAILGATITFVLGVVLLRWLTRQDDGLGPGVTALMTTAVIFGLGALMIQFFLYYVVSVVFF